MTKFLKSVNLDSVSETKHALELFGSWLPLEPEEVLELLNRNFRNSIVRSYAVNFLKQIQDDDFLLYLPQFIQALKYENFDELQKIKFDTSSEQDNKNLATSLIDRASLSSKTANFFYWLLSIELEKGEKLLDQGELEMYSTVLNLFIQALESGNEIQKRVSMNFKAQKNFVEKLTKLVKTVFNASGDRVQKAKHLQQLLSEQMDVSKFEPFPLPLDPEVLIKGIDTSKVSLYRSSWMPIKLTFLTVDDQEYVTIFKHTVDLRQDQFVLQMITLINKLMLKANIDLKLTPYKVLATSPNHGFMEFIESTTVEKILEVDGTILNFFKKQSQTKEIEREVVDTYIRSCAGYSIITYLFGVADRHFDNMLLTKNGNLIQIDFAYIFGRNSNPLPTPMKLTKEMIDAMGGLDSKNYQKFLEHCFEAFLEVRKHSNLILNLLTLMMDSSVTDISIGPEKAIKLVERNFKLELTDEEAVDYLQELINISIEAVMPQLVNQIYKIKSRFRT